MIDYAGNKIMTTGCKGCSYARHEFILPSGMIYEDEQFTLSQDWELPIVGFLVIAPKRHIEKFSELTDDERTKIFNIVNRAISYLKKYEICDGYNIIFEEKQGMHFHVWLMPRSEWMENKFGSYINSIGKIFSYAKENLKTKEVIKSINELCEKIRIDFEKNC